MNLKKQKQEVDLKPYTTPPPPYYANDEKGAKSFQGWGLRHLVEGPRHNHLPN